MRAIALTVAVVVGLAVGGGVAWAELIEVDLLAPVRSPDPGHGYEHGMVDLTATTGRSVLQIEADVDGWLGYGFRYATVSEVATLFSLGLGRHPE